MAKVNLYKKDGSMSGSVELPDVLFAVTVKPEVIHEVVVAQDANSRVRLAQVKDRSEVRGGGRKPWKQKGTGRARHGSRRSPIWSGGGVTFGPNKDRNFTKKVNKKTRKAALAMVLTDKVKEDWFIVVEDFGVKNTKTKDAQELRKSLPGTDKRVVFITTHNDESLIKSVRNLKKTSTLSAQSLNVRDLLKNTYVIISQEALGKLKETYI